MDLQVIPQKTPTRIWDLYVPIAETKTGFTAYLTNQIDTPEEYNELCHRLLVADKDEKVTLVLNTPGGAVDSALMIIDAINQSKAKITAHVTGTVASAGTMITLACDKVTVAPHSAFMIHNYSAGLAGKGNELKARQEFTDKHLNEAFRTFYTNFLSPEEMEEVIDGKDLWLSTEEVLERLSNNGPLKPKSKKKGA